MIYLTKGSTTELLFILKNESGGVIPLTGKGVTFTLKDGASNVFTLRSTIAGGSDDEIEIMDASGGSIKVIIDSALTGNLVHRDMEATIYVDADSVKTIAIRFFPFTNNTNISYNTHGTTADRPAIPQSVYIGFDYFDTTLDANVVWNGSEWVDNVSDLDGKIDTNAADIDALDTRVTSNEGDIANNTSDISSIDGRVTTNENELDDAYTSS